MTASGEEKRDPRRDEVIAGEYVLGVLPVEERRKVEMRLARDRQFAAMVSRWEENLSSFNDEYEAAVSSAAFQAGGRLQPVASGCDVAFSGRVSGGCWHSLLMWRSLALASLAVAAAVAFSPGRLLAPNAGAGLVAELSGEGAINLVARYDEASGTLRLAPVAGGAETERALQVWLVEDGRSPVSLGLLPQTGEGELIVPEAVRGRLIQGAVLSVSVEASGGSPTGSAGGPVVAFGSARYR